MTANLIWIGLGLIVLCLLGLIIMIIHDNSSQRKRINTLEQEVADLNAQIDNILMERLI